MEKISSIYIAATAAAIITEAIIIQTLQQGHIHLPTIPVHPEAAAVVLHQAAAAAAAEQVVQAGVINS